MITLDDVRRAAHRLHGVATRTPVLTAPALDVRTGARVLIKAENLQVGGAFKLRGAFNAVASLAPDELARGVLAISSGNHAQAVAIAAARCGTTAVVLMPSDAPEVKRAATLGYGAEVIEFDRYATDREALLRETAERTGRVVIHPFDDDRVIAGQGTAALELVEDAGPLDDLVVPVGGGGLLAGSAIAAAGLLPDVRTWGVEPAAGDDARQSLHAGRRVTIPTPVTIADGQQVTSPGERTFAVMQRHVTDIVTVTDDEIVAAMRFLFEHCKVVAEPSGACAVAALLAGHIPVRDRVVGVIVSGGNVDLRRFSDLVGAPA